MSELSKSRFFYTVLLSKDHPHFSDEELNALWEKYDVNKNGDLELNEIQTLMKGLVQNLKAEADFLNALLDSQIRWLGVEDNLVKLRDKFDTNHDGHVSKEEFKASANTLLFADLLRKYEKWRDNEGEFKEKESLRVSQQLK
jgi:Ca2+-binding EF-hand superfamily protein